MVHGAWFMTALNAKRQLGVRQRQTALTPLIIGFNDNQKVLSNAKRPPKPIPKMANDSQATMRCFVEFVKLIL
jgi:hypothetical protein